MSVIRTVLAMLALGLGLTALLSAAPSNASDDTAETACRDHVFDGQGYTVCTADLTTGDVRLVHRHTDGSLIGQPGAIPEAEGEDLVFAMNAGMFHMDRRPVGHYVEAGEEHVPLIRGDGPGNFQLLPNGVFWIGDGHMGVSETEAFADADIDLNYATQSGPMLVIDGALHPAFREASDSLFIRNGVGILGDGKQAVFAISNEPVNFHTFARLFQSLGADNALYLDGKVSLLYAPELERRDIGFSVGPMVAFTRPE